MKGYSATNVTKINERVQAPPRSVTKDYNFELLIFVLITVFAPWIWYVFRKEKNVKGVWSRFNNLRKRCKRLWSVPLTYWYYAIYIYFIHMSYTAPWLRNVTHLNFRAAEKFFLPYLYWFKYFIIPVPFTSLDPLFSFIVLSAIPLIVLFLFYRRRKKHEKMLLALERLHHTNLILPTTAGLGKKALRNTFLKIPMLDLDTGLLIVGAPGSGKTVMINTMVYQLDFQPNFPVVFFDPKGDYHEEFGKENDVVLKIQGSSHSWNIFSEAEQEEDFEEISAELFAAQHKDFWLSSAQQLFAAILKVIWREAKTQNKIPTNADLIHLLNTKSNDEIYELLKGYEDLRSAAQYISPESGKQGSGVMSTLLTKVMEVFVGDFRRSDKTFFSVREYMRQPAGRVLFIEYDVTQGGRLGPIYRLLIDTAIKYAISRGTENFKKYFIIDEFQWIPYLQKYQALVNYGRSYQATTITGVQAIPQMNAIYGKETTQAILAGHKYQFIFRCGDPDTVRYARSKIGKAQLWQQQNQYLPTGFMQSYEVVQSTQHLQEYCPVSEEELLRLPPGDVFYIGPQGWVRVHLRMYEESRQIIDNLDHSIRQSKKRLGLK